MAEKMLNTRIQLKYDTLANWNASTFKLKAGELAIVSLGETKDGTAAGAVNQHPVLFKVGTGNHTFSELPFASALAADVYAWAKASDVVLNDRVLQFKNGDSVVKSVTFNYITPDEASALIANALKNYSTTEQMNAAIKVEADRALKAEADLNARIDAFNLPEDGGFAALKDFNALKAKVEDEDGALARANEAYSLAETKLSTAEFNAFTGSNTSRIDEVAGSVTALANGAVKDNTEAIAAINNGTTGILATAKDYADGEIDKVEAALGKVVDGTTPVAKATDADKLGGVAAANYALKTDAQGYANTAEANAKQYTDDMKAALLGEGIKDTFDTLVEIQNWIEGDGVNATELAEAIAAEAKTRGEEDTKLQNQINALGITDGKVSNAATADIANSLSDTAKAEVKAVKVDNATNADVAAKASGLNDAGVAAVKAVKVDNAGHADTANLAGHADTANTATRADSATNAAQLDGVAAANYALKTDAQEYARGYANTAEANANSYANSLAVNYATAAQGKKADSALQEITTTANNGLKVTNKNNIDIDTDVVFVFNCGNASTQIN